MKYCMHCGKELNCYVKEENGLLYSACFECHETIKVLGYCVSKEINDKIIKHINEENNKKYAFVIKER